MSASLADVIERLLASDRNERFDSAGQVADALQKCLAEVGVDPAVPGFTLLEYLRESDPWLRRLDDHLRHSLIEGGKGYLAQGDHLAALRLFNRALSIDENNEEVLALVQGLHAEAAPESPRRSPRAIVSGVVAALGIVAAIAIGAVVAHAGPRAATSALLVTESTASAEKITSAAPDLSVEPDPGETPIDAPPLAVVPHVAPVQVPAMFRPLRSALPHSLRDDPPAAPAVPPPSETPAEVTFIVSNAGLWADVYCDGVKRASTRGDATASMQPGDYKCTFKSALVEDEDVTFQVVAGEKKDVRASVRTKPLRVPIDGCADDCVVALDDRALGTVKERGSLIVIERPEDAHTLTVTCGKLPPQSSAYNGQAIPFRCAPLP